MSTRADGDKLKIFISYSRTDLYFADQLEAALAACGYYPLIDRHGIGGGEAWRDRLSKMIQEADTVIYVLSPDSATSEIVQWEVDETDRWGKRLIPVVCRPLSNTSPPQRLKDLNYVHFYAEPKVPGSGFGQGLARLMAALDTDFDWICRHTRLGALAARWDEGSRSSERLLTGKDIAEAKAWAAHRPKGGSVPDVTALMIAFIRASEDGELDRQKEARRQLEERERIVEAAEADRRARETALNEREAAIAQTARLKRLQAMAAGIVLAIFAGFTWWGYGAWSTQQAVAIEAERTNLRGQILAFASAQGEEILDVAPGHKTSPYTTFLVEKLKQRHKPIAEAIVDAHQGVTDIALKSNLGTQRPFLSTSMNGQLYIWRQPASRKKRVLIIVGDNPGDDHPQLRLQGPPYDADLITAVLIEAGFKASEITRLDNPPLVQVQATLTTLAKELKAYPDPQERLGGKSGIDRSLTASPFQRVGLGLTAANEPPVNTLLLLFFTGHGVSIRGENFLMVHLAGEKLENHEAMRRVLLPVDDLTRAIDRIVAASIVILDTHFPPLDQPKITR